MNDQCSLIKDIYSQSIKSVFTYMKKNFIFMHKLNKTYCVVFIEELQTSAVFPSCTSLLLVEIKSILSFLLCKNIKDPCLNLFIYKTK